MSWTLLVVLILLLALAVGALVRRQFALRALESSLSDLRDARERGSHRARLQYPLIDLTRCIGCGLCVRACPEDGVLDLLHGQAVVVHGARCVGHALCVDACPTDGIRVTLGDLSERRDIPALTAEHEAKGSPGLFLAGELTGFALIRTAITHGSAVAREVARRTREAPSSGAAADGFDLVIVGAGPAGIACSLAAREAGLRFVTIERELLGGTVSHYPRRKLVMTQPVVLPLYGRMRHTTYSKEELVELWHELAEKHELPVETGVDFQGLERGADGWYTVRTSRGELRARHVCLSLGRRGTPRKLGVPGEDTTKVAYSLIDAQSYRGRRIVVVGGGDSAVEAALGLAAQPGNQVTLSYRKRAIFRVKAKNQARLDSAVTAGTIDAIYESQVTAIEPDRVHLRVNGGGDRVIPNDEVFVFAGGVPPFPLLEKCGVSFAPEDRDPVLPEVERGTGLLAALSCALVLAVLAGGYALFHSTYYGVGLAERATSMLHAQLRPAGVVGLTFGILAVVLILFNITYLLRRLPVGDRLPGSLQTWMTGHMVTGILAFLFVLLHAGLAVRGTVGGRAFLALAFLLLTGAFGRYVYSFVPRAANGRIAELDEVKARVDAISGEWDRAGGGFGERVRAAVQHLADRSPWNHSFVGRLRALLSAQRRLDHVLSELHDEGVAADVPHDQLRNVLTLARQAHRNALMASHYEDLRGLLGTWRYFHRWVALLMFLLAAMHIVTAIRFAGLSIDEVGAAPAAWWGNGR